MATKLLFLVLVVIFSVNHIYTRLKDGNISVKKIVSLLISPILFPLGMFVYGYIFYPASFVPSFVLWGFSWNLLFFLVVYIVIITILQLIISRVNYRSVIKDLTPEILTGLCRGSLLNLSLIGGVGSALSAGVFEEMFFRFIAITAFIPWIHLLGSVLSLNAIVIAIPPWLSLWAVSSVSPSLFLAAFLANLIFCYLHLFDLKNSGVIKKSYWFRPLNTWFPGWLYFLYMVNFGILGAIFAHFLVDFIGIVIGLYMILGRIRSEVESGTFSLIEISKQT